MKNGKIPAIKILGDGEIDKENHFFESHCFRFSQRKIEKAGGKAA